MPGDSDITCGRQLTFKDTANLIREIICENWPGLLLDSFRKAGRWIAPEIGHFQIAVCGSFCAGKSTTVNAIADGYEICPRGSGVGGIRTSACAIKVSWSPKDREEVIIDWKYPKQLVKDIAYWLGIDNMQITPEQLVKDSELLFSVKQLLKQLHDEKSYTMLDRIKHILMLISFYDNPDVKRWQSRKTFTHEEAMSFLAFQDDFYQRWGKVFYDIESGTISNISDLAECVRKNFKPENAMYLFIAAANVSIPSNYLHSIGITIIDISNMNIGSDYTCAALQCMADSAAIFYLFSGNTELSSDDKEALMEIKRAKLADKVFFGLNFRGDLKRCSYIEESILADLQMLGYTAKHQKRLLHYNAFLAQRAKQGMLILSGKMNQAGKDKLMSEAQEAGCEVNDVTEAWIETTDMVLHYTKAEGWRDFYKMGFCRESIELVYRASQWEEAMTPIFQYAITAGGTRNMSDSRNIVGELRRALFIDAARFIREIVSREWPDYLINSFNKASRYFASRTEHFQIAVCGLYQAGKSLTVNMMTGGSEISPVSTTEASGIRTSACNIYFYGSDCESAQIFWLSDSELAQRLSSLLDININSNNLWNVSASGIIESKFVSMWNSAENHESMEYTALLVSWMQRLPELRRNYSAPMKLDEAMQLSSASDDERTRWRKVLRFFPKIKDINAFKNDLRQIFPINEVMYTLIKKISARIISRWMQRNNICIVDTPGLNVNSQDSHTADEAVANVDALIYVFGGTSDKEPSESESNFILNLKSKIGDSPVVFAMNFPAKPKNAILDSIATLVRLGGYDEKSIISYNALLSYRVAQGRRLLTGELDDKTAKSLITRAAQNGEKVSSPSEAWKVLVYDELYNFSKTDAKKILCNGLCEGSIKILRNFSGKNNFIIENIISDDSKISLNSLMRTQVFIPIETRLQELVEQLSDYRRFKREFFEELQRKFHVFAERKKSEFQDAINSSWPVSIAGEMFDSIRDVIPDIAWLLARLYTEPDSVNFNDEWIVLLNQSFYKWGEKFINKGAGTSARVLDIAGERFYKPDVDDEILSEIWKMKIISGNVLFTMVLSDIVNNPSPVYGDENIYNNYILPLIKEGAQAAISSRYFQKYISEKTSWNPFIDHQQRMVEARYKLGLDIQSRIAQVFTNLWAEAVSSFAVRTNGQPMRCYTIAENWVSDIITSSKQYLLSLRENELSSLSMAITGISKYYHDKFAEIKLD